MGITVSLVDEDCRPVGEAVGDPTNLLHRLLPPPDDGSYQCLRFVDWYGDTTFNVLQMSTLLTELARIGQDADPEGRRLLARIAVLAKQCEDSVHMYVKFIGD